MEIVVVYELDRPPGAARTGEAGAQAPVRVVHVAPGAPGDPAHPGPRTFCGKDTFAMQKAPWRPADRPGSPWYPPEFADRICGTCDSTMEDEG